MAESTDLTDRAERAVRRGELLLAIELYESALAHNPEDERVRQRMESVRSLLHPSELVNRRRSEPETQETGPVDALSPAEEGELHASAGRFDQALRCYERAVAGSPANELVRERLDELRKLASPGARADLATAEHLPAAAPARTPADRSARVAQASFAPLTPAAAPASRKDKTTLLRELLARVRAGRRGAVPDA